MPNSPPPASPLDITRALVAAGYPAAEVAPAVAAAFPTLDATGLAGCLLDAQAFPATDRQGLVALLSGVGRFSEADVTGAADACFPPTPQPEPEPQPQPEPEPHPQPEPQPQPQPPAITAITASQQGGDRGVELWVVGPSGQISTRYQTRPGADWSGWEGPGFKGQPGGEVFQKLAAAQQNDGHAPEGDPNQSFATVRLFTLDTGGRVWSIPQGWAGGDWNAWEAPNPSQPLAMQEIAASQQGGDRGVELWGVDPVGRIWTLYQLTPNGSWSAWEGPGFKDQPRQMKKIAAAQQNNGCVWLWSLDLQAKLWGIGQAWPGGDWNAWQDFPNQPCPFIEITASEQRGSRGVQLWALGEDGQIWTLYQLTAGGPWSNWEGPGFLGQPAPMRLLAAALQNTGNVALTAVDAQDRVWTIDQAWPGGDWNGWVQAPAPPA